MAPPPLFELADVSLDIDGTHILDHVDLTIAAGGITVVVGPSGAGKSTVLRLLDRLEVPTSGKVRFRGDPVADLDPLVLRRQVGMVFQRPAPFPGTVATTCWSPTPTPPTTTWTRPSGPPASTPPSSTAPPTTCRVARRSACASPARSSRGPTCCSWTSRRPRSIPTPAAGSSAPPAGWRARATTWCGSRTTSSRPTASPTTWSCWWPAGWPTRTSAPGTWPTRRPPTTPTTRRATPADDADDPPAGRTPAGDADDPGWRRG